MQSPRFCLKTLLAAAAASALASNACEEAGPRIYTARAYRGDFDCLAHYEPIGLVEAEALPATCVPVCLLLGEQIYVSTVCGPYPLTATVITPEESPDCESALAALEAELFCDAES